MIQTVSFVGAGKLATALAIALKEKGLDIVEIISTGSSASKLAVLVDAKTCHSVAELKPVDLVLVAVSDKAIPAVIAHLPNGQVWAHTSGSVELATHVRTARGVFYPLQTFSGERKLNWSEIPICVESSDAGLLQSLLQLGHLLSEQVVEMSSEQRRWLHIAAVFACNFSNHLYHIADEMMSRHGLPSSMLHPLILETARKAVEAGPGAAQTGPARRNDLPVLKRQELMLQNDKELLELYRLFSQRIIRTSHEEL